VNRFIAFILSFALLFQSFGLSTDLISKITEVVEHAKFHNAEYGDNLMVFISKHYGELMAEHDDEHHEDEGQHEKLPFKQTPNFICGISLAFLSHTTELPDPPVKESYIHTFFYKSALTSSFTDRRLRPPRRS
jgi:hypothetical protein